MYSNRSNLLDMIASRKLLKQVSASSLPDKCCIYCGFDATSASLHIGHLIVMRILRIAKSLGHTTICIIGSGTTLLGDPTWKNETRPMLDKAVIAQNAEKMKKQLIAIAQPDHILDNKDWYSSINILEFMRDIAAHFSVNQLLTMETFRTRLDSQKHLSFMEFSYPLLQAYDFLHLHQKYDCDVQLGGSDQWGNITQGLGFVKRVTGNDVYGMTNELLTNASGEKMGKTSSGALFLDPDLVTPYDFWQFWRNVGDDDVEKLLLQLTDIPEADIHTSLSDIKNAKKLLADEVTSLVHGPDNAAAARRRSEEVFEHGSYDDLEPIEFASSVTLADLLVKLQFVLSISDAKRSIKGGSVTINNIKILDHKHILNTGEHVLCYAKKRYAKVIIK